MRPQAGQQCSVVPHTGTWIEIMERIGHVERGYCRTPHEYVD